jgi:anti-sigma-K factor RskA
MDVNRTPCGEDVAPYALGALGPDDARRFEEHLAGCELCQTDLNALRPVVDTLPETPEQIAPPAHLKRELMAVVEAEAAQRAKAERPERAWLPRIAVPALATAMAAAVVAAFVLTGGGDAVEYQSPPGPGGARATLTVEGDDGEIHVEGMPAPEEGRVMQVWLMRDGSTTPEPTDALFTPNADGDASVTVPGDMDGVTRVLISDEPDGGSRAPTTAPSVDFKLS